MWVEPGARLRAERCGCALAFGARYRRFCRFRRWGLSAAMIVTKRALQHYRHSSGLGGFEGFDPCVGWSFGPGHEGGSPQNEASSVLEVLVQGSALGRLDAHSPTGRDHNDPISGNQHQPACHCRVWSASHHRTLGAWGTSTGSAFYVKLT